MKVLVWNLLAMSLMFIMALTDASSGWRPVYFGTFFIGLMTVVSECMALNRKAKAHDSHVAAAMQPQLDYMARRACNKSATEKFGS
jgi:hypothetical protein